MKIEKDYFKKEVKESYTYYVRVLHATTEDEEEEKEYLHMLRREINELWRLSVILERENDINNLVLDELKYCCDNELFRIKSMLLKIITNSIY